MFASDRKKDEIQFETFVLDQQTLLSDITKFTELNKKMEDLLTGDIIVMTPVEQSLDKRDKHLNEAKFYFVNTSAAGEKYLCEMNKAPNGWSIIPVSVSKALEVSFKGDFVQDYMKKYLKLFQDYLNCFKGIELDLESKLIPAEFLAKNHVTSNNINNNELRVFYFFENPVQSEDGKDFDGDLFVWVNKAKSGNIDLDENFISLTKNLENLDIEMDDSLNTSADRSQLNMSDMDKTAERVPTFESIADRDLEMEEYAKQFKSIYENQFKSYLRRLKKNDILSVTSLPTNEYCKETFESDLMNSTTLSFQFDSLELDDNGQISSVIMTSYDRLHTYYFDPVVCGKYGPFFTTTLYTCMYNVGKKNSVEQPFFLDLPLELYNLLEEDE